jgi:hypothetical protein
MLFCGVSYMVCGILVNLTRSIYFKTLSVVSTQKKKKVICFVYGLWDLS